MSPLPSGVYDRYSSRNLRSLIVELRSLVDESEKDELNRALIGTINLNKIHINFSETYRSNPSIDLRYELLNDLISVLAVDLDLERWKKPFQVEFPELKKSINDLKLKKALDELNKSVGDTLIEDQIRTRIR